MALPATEAFTGASAALSGSWTQARPTDGTVNKDGSGKGQASAAADPMVWWNADTFDPNHYAQAEVYSVGTGGSRTCSPCVRCSGTSNATSSGYIYQCGDNLYKLVSGTFTSLASDPASGSWVDADVARLEAASTAIKMKRNGTQIGSTVTDSALSSGAAGLHLFNNSTNRVDNWQGDNLVPAVTARARVGAFELSGRLVKQAWF